MPLQRLQIRVLHQSCLPDKEVNSFNLLRHHPHQASLYQESENWCWVVPPIPSVCSDNSATVLVHADAGSDSIVTGQHKPWVPILYWIRTSSNKRQQVNNIPGGSWHLWGIFFDPSQHFFSQARYISVKSFVILMHYQHALVVRASYHNYNISDHGLSPSWTWNI